MQPVDPQGSFLRNLVLSVLLIGLSSLLFPVVLQQIDDRKAVDRQRFEAELERQDRIIDAQADLLDSLAADFWEYEEVAADVVYSRDERFGQDGWHARAVATYYARSGPLLADMRADISSLLRLAPHAMYESFLGLYEGDLLAFDSCLLELMKQESTSPADTETARCAATEGRFANAGWDALTAFVLDQELATNADRQFEALARAFSLEVPGE